MLVLHGRHGAAVVTAAAVSIVGQKMTRRPATTEKKTVQGSLPADVCHTGSS